MGRISKYRRYVIDVTGLDSVSLGELVGGRLVLKSEKIEVILTSEGVIGS